MTRARPFLLLPLLAITSLAVAACATERKPIRGFDKPPPGSIVLDSDPGGAGGDLAHLRPACRTADIPAPTQRPGRGHRNLQRGLLRLRHLDDAGLDGRLGQPARLGSRRSTYVVELVDGAGKSWGKSAPLPIPASGGPYNPSGQSPGVVFINFDGQTGSWTIDPATQDADTATDEITVTNLLGENVVVERCTIADDERTSCTPVGTVAPQADLRTVETTVASSKADHPGLFIHLASDASQSYQRDLVQGGGNFASSCQIERILVHGTRGTPVYSPTGTRRSRCPPATGTAAGRSERGRVLNLEELDLEQQRRVWRDIRPRRSGLNRRCVMKSRSICRLKTDNLRTLTEPWKRDSRSRRRGARGCRPGSRRPDR